MNYSKIHSKILLFLWWCAGGNPDILKETPTAQAKYNSLGLCNLFAGLLNSIACGYLIYAALNSIWLALLSGSIWGILILHINRFTLSSSIREYKTQKTFHSIYGLSLFLIPRIALAVLISVTISTPLQIAIFSESIEKQNQEPTQYFEIQINQAKADITNLNNRLQKENDAVELRLFDYLKEVKGVNGTGKSGNGAAAAILYKVYLEQKEEFKKDKLEIEERKQIRSIEIQYLERQKEQISTSAKITESDPLYKLKAFENLKDKDLTVAIICWTITLFIFLLDGLPMLMALLSPITEYDFKVILNANKLRKRIESLDNDAVLNEFSGKVQKIYNEALDSSLLNPREEKHL